MPKKQQNKDEQGKIESSSEPKDVPVPKEQPRKQEPPKPKKDEAKVVQLQERLFTLERFSRSKGELGRAFLVSQSLANGSKVIKRSRAEWETLYAKWLKAPRA